MRAEELFAAMPRLESDFLIFSGGRWFRRRTPHGQPMAQAEVADAIDGPWRRFVDLGAHANGRMLAIDVFVPSPDGRKLILGFNVDGREYAELRVATSTAARC